MSRRLLLLANTTGYQTRMFGEAAERLGVELVFATDRCQMLDDPWRDGAIAVRFHDEDASLRAIVEAAAARPIDGVLALGDRPTVLAALAAQALGLPGHPPEAVRAAASKQLTRERLAAAGLPAPWFRVASREADPDEVLPAVTFPCVVKPLALSASRGVMRADDAGEFRGAWRRLQRLLERVEIRALRDPANDAILVEGFIDGAEFALEGILDAGALRVLAIFAKPDPLDGPFFEETVYVAPPTLSADVQDALVGRVQAAVDALSLTHGPVHAEVRVSGRAVYVLEVAARPIGGLCARALRFTAPGRRPLPFEELLLTHALGEPVAAYQRERAASAVLMVPIPREGIYRRVDGMAEARAVPGVDEVRVTAKADQRLEPPPEGGSYLGFIFARADTPDAAVAALRAAHARLRFVIDAPIPVVDGRGSKVEAR